MNWMDRLNERAELMGRMLETIGAMKGLPGEDHADIDLEVAARRCISCEGTEECRHWLDSHSDGADAPLKACPNAALFQSWLKV
ncbi:hypothetical protein FJ695_22160 [Labrenzia sp. PHM005]|nr:hypothetical protein FJ695_22160 [Labrenzia sp. PHM005]